MTCGGEEEISATGGGEDGGGGDVVELAATRADVGRHNESGRGRECCRAGGGWWTTRLKGEGGRREALPSLRRTKDDKDGWDLPPPQVRWSRMV